MGYSPTLGRFLQRDPNAYIDGTNLYQSASDEPTNLLDPLGLAATQPPTTQPPVTQPTTQPGAVNVVIKPGLFQVGYGGPGLATFKQTVEITPCPCVAIPDAVRTHEKGDHGGADPFQGPVGDNDTGDPNKPYGGKGHRPNGGDRVKANQMTDTPGFPDPYPKGWCGKKSFVTTVIGPNGDVLKTIKWSASLSSDGSVTYKSED
jgi:hypothetical protein